MKILPRSKIKHLSDYSLIQSCRQLHREKINFDFFSMYYKFYDMKASEIPFVINVQDMMLLNHSRSNLNKKKLTPLVREQLEKLYYRLANYKTFRAKHED